MISFIVPIHKKGDKKDGNNYVQNFAQHPSLKVNSTCRGNYWRSSMWVPTRQVDY